MRTIHVITVGKLKESGLIAFEQEYLKRVNKFQVHIHELKAFAEDLSLEGKEVVAKIKELQKQSSNLKIILLMEKGKERDSVEFAQIINQQFNEGRDLAFIIGGASGHGEDVLALPNDKISLSQMTFPHQVARIVLIEQIYRAQTIIAGHPYHK